MSCLPIDLSADEQRSAWEEAERQTLLYGAALTFRKRLEWIEETLWLARRFSGAASGRRMDRDGQSVTVVREEIGQNTYRVR